jgi:hypothetical protein
MSDPSAARRATAIDLLAPGGLLVDQALWILLVVAFFLGPVKLLGGSWLSYLSADGLAALVLLVVFTDRVVTRKPLFAASPLSLPLVLLGAFCVAELINPEAPFIRSILGVRSWLLYLSFYFVGLYTFRSLAQLERLYSLLLALGLLTAIYGVYQWQSGPESFASWSDYYGRYARLAWIAQSGTVFRAFSTFVAAGTFGGNMALLMLIALGVTASSRIPVGWRVAAGFTFAAMGVGIAASGSRGPAAHLLLAAVVSLAFIPGFRQRVAVGFKALSLTLVAVAAVALFIGPAMTERYASIFDPEAFFWKWFGPFTNGLRIALGHPFGMGLGYTAGIPQFVSSAAFQGLPATNIDSGYGSAAAELGLVGLGLFLYLAAKVGIEGFRIWRALPPGRLRDLLLGPALMAVTYPLVSVIAQPQATLPSSIYYWLLIGMLMKAPAIQRRLDKDQRLRSEEQARE